VDARLHHLQGKAKRVKPAELLDFLREFYREKSAMRERHAAGARLVADYDFNNTYQWIINREDLHLNWLRDAIEDLGGTVEDGPEPRIDAHGKRDEAQRSVISQDRDAAQAFVDRWRDRVEKVTNARNRNMLRVILGETLEQRRFFDQALAGRSDLLGRRADGAGTPGAVMPTRWVE
jgi:Mn-containing catalase